MGFQGISEGNDCYSNQLGITLVSGVKSKMLILEHGKLWLSHSINSFIPLRMWEGLGEVTGDSSTNQASSKRSCAVSVGLRSPEQQPGRMQGAAGQSSGSLSRTSRLITNKSPSLPPPHGQREQQTRMSQGRYPSMRFV